MIIVPIAYFGGGIVTTAGSLWLWHKVGDAQSNNKNNNNNDNNDDNVSSRGVEASQSAPLPYFKSYFKAIANPCHHITNQTGYVALCVAENKLILPELSNHLINGLKSSSNEKSSASSSTAKIAFGNEVNFCYNDTRGIENVRQQVAKFITKNFIHGNKNSNQDSSLAAKAEQIVLGAGAAAILNFIFRFVAEENDVVLIPAPYYAAFEYDMSIIAKCVPYPVHMDDPAKGPNTNELEQVYQTLHKQGRKVRSLLLTNPNNPLGIIYSPDTIRNCIAWARSKNMHTIVDEIYALSVHDVSFVCRPFF